MTPTEPKTLSEYWSLSGRLALVTGGTQGLGLGIVEALAANGAHVLVGSRELDRASKVAEDLKAEGYLADGLEIDVADEASVRQAFAKLRDTGRVVDILVNNVGTTAYEPFEDITAETWDRVMAVNVRSAFLCSQQALTGMVQKKSGQIINIGSIWSTKGGPHRAAYITSKHALVGLTRALDEEFASQGVRVNMVNPGPVRTEKAASYNVDSSDWLLPADIGAVVAYLACPNSTAIGGVAVDAFGRGKVLTKG